MSHPASTKPVVLLVEDEGQLAAALVANLEEHYEIDLAANAEEAGMMLGMRQYHAIISDHLMPGQQQGLDFLIEALQRQPTAKRILMTGYLNPDLLGRSLALAQLHSCLLKPVEMPRLRQELHMLLTT